MSTQSRTPSLFCELMKLSNDNDYVLPSLYVPNLFTNMPLDEALLIFMDSFFDNVSEIHG